MSATQTTLALRQLREVSPAAALPDSELLGRFLASRDEGAFEALVRRHGPLVLGVCKRLLRQRQDAEDAFQAAFLVLARRAASIHSRQSLGSWLYGVAYRVATKARTRAASRVRHELHASAPAEADALAEVSGRELLALLDGELHAMAARDRDPLVQCYLEGRTRDEVASLLGCSPSTLQRRLERARERLGLRLERRGLHLPAVLLGVGLT